MSNLRPKDWVRAAIARIVEHGVNQVRVESLARDLGVSKGSFYWHFTNRAALLDAVLANWEQEATEAIIDEVESDTEDPADKLWVLMKRAFVTSVRDDSFEASLRIWAGQDPQTKRVVRRVDRRRVGYVAGLLCDHGIDELESRARAELMYRTLIGEYSMRSFGARRLPESTLRSLYALLMGSSRSRP